MYNSGIKDQLETTIFYYGKVLTNSDDLSGNRIQVRIKGVDDSIQNEDLSYAFPMLQKFVHVIPKIGETVLIFVPNVKNPFIDRVYLGPLISQPQMLKADNELYSSKSALDSGHREGSPSPKTIPENKGVYPLDGDVAFQGRDNTDLIFRKNEVLLRAGKYNSDTVKGEIPKFNKTNPSYIQIKHDVIFKKATDTTEEEKGGAINILSNKINLLTHKNGSPRFTLNVQTNHISDKELERIVNEAHPLVFGDDLITYLKLLRNAFLNHVHAYPGMKPQDLSGGNEIDKYLEFPMNSLLSKNIKIN